MLTKLTSLGLIYAANAASQTCLLPSSTDALGNPDLGTPVSHMQSLLDSETVDSQYRLASVDLCKSPENGLLTGFRTTVTRVDIDSTDVVLSQHQMAEFGSTQSDCTSFVIDYAAGEYITALEAYWYPKAIRALYLATNFDREIRVGNRASGMVFGEVQFTQESQLIGFEGSQVEGSYVASLNSITQETLCDLRPPSMIA